MERDELTQQNIYEYTMDTTLKKMPYTALLNNHTIPKHKHFFWEITYSVSGELLNIVNGKEILCKPLSTIILMKPGEIHQIVNNKNEDCSNLHHRDIYISNEKMQRICNMLDPNLYKKLINSTPLCLNASKDNLESLEYNLNLFHVSEAYFFNHVKTLDQLHTTIIFQILGIYLRQEFDDKKSYPSWIDDFFNNLKDVNYLTKNITEILNGYPYSHGYMCREFKKIVGKTMVQCLNESRLKYSTILLLNSSNSILNIAMSLNYSSQNAYIMAFKKFYHVSPNIWRKEMQKSIRTDF